MQTVYQNGTVVSIPDTDYYPRPPKDLARPDKCFRLSFKHKMKIFDAAHIQHLDYSNATRSLDCETWNIINEDINHVFLTPTFSTNDVQSYVDGNDNLAMGRFTTNLRNNYGMTSFVWVKEYTTKNPKTYLTPHFHMLLTLPYTHIKELNKAWSAARGDLTTLPNALRSGYDKKTGKSYMKIRSYQAAVGYAAKYISKADYGNVSRFKMSCKIKEHKTWEAVTGHATKCYGLSNNLLRDPRQLDLFREFQLHPYLASSCREHKGDFADLFFFDDPVHSNQLYNAGTEKESRVSFVISDAARIAKKPVQFHLDF